MFERLKVLELGLHFMREDRGYGEETNGSRVRVVVRLGLLNGMLE